MTQIYSKDVKTRKPHRCFACLRTFPEGTKMNYQTNVYDGDLYSLYTCETCIDIMALSNRDDYGEGFEEGFVREQLTGSEDPEWLLKRLIHQNRLVNLQIGDTVLVELISRDISSINSSLCGFVVIKDKYRNGKVITILDKKGKKELIFDPIGWPLAKCYMKRIVLTEKINKIFLRKTLYK
ncbi:MAG: hypothetical protein Q8O88_04125 [bacterium]|nr:hypothetical protein [bacterium]